MTIMEDSASAREGRFRRLTDDDLPLMHRWLNDPGVVRWWEGDDVTWSGVVADYGSENQDPVQHWIYLADGRPIGWIQNYRLRDLPEAARLWNGVGHDPDVVGIDYLVGDPGRRGRGIGSGMIRRFCQLLFQGLEPPPQVAADPVEANVASWRALENAGFRCLGIVRDQAHGPVKIMALDNPNQS